MKPSTIIRRIKKLRTITLPKNGKKNIIDEKIKYEGKIKYEEIIKYEENIKYYEYSDFGNIEVLGGSLGIRSGIPPCDIIISHGGIPLPWLFERRR